MSRDGADDGLEIVTKEFTGNRLAPSMNVSDLLAAMASTQYPSPKLLGQILELGEPAVEPLMKILASRPRGVKDERSIPYAAYLLSDLASARALPEVASAIRYYANETGYDLAESLAEFGSPGFEAALELIQDPAIVGELQVVLIDVATEKMASDPPAISRLSAAVRQALDEVGRQLGEAKQFEDQLVESADLADSFDDDQSSDEDDGNESSSFASPGRNDDQEPSEAEYLQRNAVENEIELQEVAEHLAEILAGLDDPENLKAIKRAREAGWVEITDQEIKQYAQPLPQADQIVAQRTHWLDEYRRLYEELQAESPAHSLERQEFPTRESYPDFKPQPTPERRVVQPQEPVRYASERIGRNDPCWCGSGKKYKKCHYGRAES